MTPFELFVFVSLFFDAVLGIGVGLNNPRRAANQLYTGLSLCIFVWLGNNWITLYTHNESVALWTIRCASIFAALIPTCLQLLRMAIKYSNESAPALLRRGRPLFLLNLLIALICLTPYFLPAMRIPDATQIAEPEYGPAFLVYTLYFLFSVISLISMFVRDWKQLRGAQRAELEFVILGSSTALLIGTVFSPLLALLTHTSRYVPVANATSIITLTAIIAYGIATRRILEVATVIRRAVAYALLTGYLVAIYLAAWYPADVIRCRLSSPYDIIPHILATLVVAFSLIPAHGLMQRFADRLFINPGATDVGRTIQKAGVLLQAVTTMDDLLTRFSKLVSEAIGTDRVVLLIEEAGRFVQPSASADHAAALVLDAQAPLIRKLKAQNEPLVMDVIQRARAVEQWRDVLQQMRQMGSTVAVGVKSKDVLEAVLLLGPQLSGRIYGAVEQNALQLLCNQLAVALENARLYTEVQDGKIYNDILLDHLVSGVIAVNTAGLVSVFNREAQRVTRLSPGAVLHQSYQTLPPPLAQTLATLLARDTPLRNAELVLMHGEEMVTIRAGGALFKGHTGKLLGALLVFSDITDIKKMEMQLRRSDRLASLGILSAGMAHEIKNPLVTLKTFSQLLPERYDDRDFRDTFSTLVGHEIRRIDSIVNQLLHFARPAEPRLAPVSLHPVLEHSLKLVAEELRTKNIVLVCFLFAPRDRLLADSNQLSQVFLNLFLNAIESMRGGGQLTVTTDAALPGSLAFSGRLGKPAGEQIHISIADTGSGIKPEDLAHIFDPFFTTKSEGTGLGLSVAHGIIEEHGGLIDVDSTVAKGAIFHIYFPLVSERVINTESSHESATSMPAV